MTKDARDQKYQDSLDRLVKLCHKPLAKWTHAELSFGGSILTQLLATLLSPTSQSVTHAALVEMTGRSLPDHAMHLLMDAALDQYLSAFHSILNELDSRSPFKTEELWRSEFVRFGMTTQQVLAPKEEKH